MSADAPVLTLDDGWVDLRRRQVHRGGATEDLTPLEAELLAYLLARTPEPVARVDLLTEVWQYAASTQTRTVENTIRRLRIKLERDPSDPVVLQTVRGHGYRLVATREAEVLLGRGEALRALSSAVQDAPLVSVVGAGGVGKTTLAAHFATQRGWTVVSLGGETTRAGSVRRVAQVLGIGAQQALDATSSAIAAVLRERPMVLDECEAVLEVLADDLEVWKGGAGLVLTSRRASALEGERVLTLHGLDAAAAAQLFCQRVAEASGVELSPDDPGVSKIVARFGGRPLALELVAVRTRLLRLDEVVARLDRVGLTDVGPGRHGSLQQVVRDSWRLIDASLQTALARCAVFVGPFAAGWAEALLEDLGPPLTLLEDLVANSLLQRRYTPAGPRLVMLPAVRRFARETITADEAERAEELRRAWLLAEELPQEAVHELVSACEQCSGAVRYALMAHGRTRLQERVAPRTLLALLEGEPPVPLQAWRARLLRTIGDIDGSARAIEDTLTRARNAPPEHLTEALHAQASIAQVAGDLDTAIAALTEAAARARQAGLDDQLAAALASLGTAYASQGAHDRSESHLRDALELARGQRPGLEVMIRNGLANLHLHRGQTQAAARQYARAMTRVRDMGNLGGLAVLAHNQALVHVELGELEAAETALRESMAAHASQGRRPSFGIAQGNLGRVLLLQGRVDEAIEALEASISELRRVRLLPRELFFRLAVVLALAEDGRPDEARAALERARVRAGDNPLPAGFARLAEAAVAAAGTEVEDARRILADLVVEPIVEVHARALRRRVG